MQIKFWLSDGNTGIAEWDSRGLRITESTYSWINPPAGMAYYLEEACLRGGPILAASYQLDEKGLIVEPGMEFGSGRSITRYTILD